MSIKLSDVHRVVNYSKGNSNNNALSVQPINNGRRGIPSTNILGQYLYSDGINFIAGGDNIILGSNSGKNNQGESAIAIGYQAGQNTQGSFSVSIGYQSGYNVQGISCVSIGKNAGYQNQNNDSIAIGYEAGKFSQGTNAIAIGYRSSISYQSNDAIAIGNNCVFSQGSNSIAIGSNASLTQNNNSIIINATGTPINDSIGNACYIAPIRQVTYGSGSVTTYGTLAYQGDSIVFDSTKTFIIDHPKDNDKYLVHSCLEGPENGVYYRGTGEITNNKYVKIQLPEYTSYFTDFSITITQYVKDDNVNYDNNNYITSNVKNNEFFVLGNNGTFYWTVFAKRTADFNVEPYKSDIEIFGDGPYKYYKNVCK